MAAGDRPRRSTRNSQSSQEKEEPPKKSKNAKKVEEEHDDGGFNEELYDTGGSSDEDDVDIKPWLKKNLKKVTKETKETKEDKPIIPKRKRDTQAPPVAAAEVPKEEIKPVKKGKKKEPASLISNMAPEIFAGGDKATSSLIGNMIPADAKKQQPAIRDWKSKNDYHAFISHTRAPKASNANANANPSSTTNINANANAAGNVNASAKSNSPPRNQGVQTDQKKEHHQQQQQQQQQPMSKSNSTAPNKKVELGNKIRKELNGLIFKVLESKGKKHANLLEDGSSAMDLLDDVVGDYGSSRVDKDKNPDAIDWVSCSCYILHVLIDIHA